MNSIVCFCCKVMPRWGYIQPNGFCDRRVFTIFFMLLKLYKNSWKNTAIILTRKSCTERDFGFCQPEATERRPSIMDGQLRAIGRVQFYPDVVAGRHFRNHEVASRTVPVPARVHVWQVPAWRHYLRLYGAAMLGQDGRVKYVQARFLHVKHTRSGVIEMRIVNKHVVKNYRLVSDHVS